ncbi:MAG: hypothetical protein KGO53_06405 [Alphaproteobacteria bacterium]|nr:hypothetical protein [Alphaproteobacteria bacterium]
MIPVQHIHPMLVHFPIVLVILLAGVDTFATLLGKSVTGRSTLGNVSLVLVLLSAAFALATFFFGGLALDVAEQTGFHSDIAETHEMLGTIVAVSTAAYALLRAFLWWRDARVTGAGAFLFPVLGFAASALVGVTAFYGGQLVYELGVNVTKIAMN